MFERRIVVIGIIPNATRDKGLNVTKSVIECLEQQKLEVRVDTEVAKLLGREDIGCEEFIAYYFLCRRLFKFITKLIHRI